MNEGISNVSPKLYPLGKSKAPLLLFVLLLGGCTQPERAEEYTRYSAKAIYSANTNEKRLKSLIQLSEQIIDKEGLCSRLVDRTLAEVELLVTDLSEIHESPLSHMDLSKFALTNGPLSPCRNFCVSKVDETYDETTRADCYAFRRWRSQKIFPKYKGLN